MEQAAAQAPGCNVQSSAQHASSAGVELVRTLRERHQYRTEVLATVNRHQPLLAVHQRCCKVLEECAPWPAALCRLPLACWGCLSGLLWVVNNQLLYQGESPGSFAFSALGQVNKSRVSAKMPMPSDCFWSM